MPVATDHRKCSWLCAGILVLGIASVIAIARLLWGAFEKVMTGHGLDTYRTFWLVEFNYIGVLVLFGVVVMALILAGGLWLHEWWQIRTLMQKYGPKDTTT